MKPGLPLSSRGRWQLAAALLAAVVILAAGLRLFCWPFEASPIDVQLVDIAGIQLEPYPEGPPGLAWNHPPTSPYSEQLTQIEAAIPIPLPGPEVQPIGCSGVGNMIIHLRDGRDITYGPCRHPAAIRALWSRMVRVLADPNCREPCGPTQ